MRAIAKQTVKIMTPLKWFDTTGFEEAAPNPIQASANMYCKGFSIMSNERQGSLPGSSIALQYGTINTIGAGALKPMDTLCLGRCFSQTTGNLTLRRNAPETQSIRVNTAETRVLLERRQVDTATDLAPEGAPMLVRILHLRCKDSHGGQATYDPRIDAFQNYAGQAIGVSTPGFDKTTLALSKVNRDKYVVIDDMTFTLLPPMIDQETTGDGIRAYPTYPTVNGARILTFKHDIGKNLKYAPASSQTARGDSSRFPVSGQKQSFLLFHFQYIGDNQIAANRNSANSVRMSIIPEGTFRD